MADVTVVSSESPTKKAKFEGVHENLANLSQFKLEKILHNNTNRKSVCLKGKFEELTGDALVLLEKTAFAEENLQNGSDYFTEKSQLKKVFHNDIYGDYKYFPQINLNFCASKNNTEVIGLSTTVQNAFTGAPRLFEVTKNSAILLVCINTNLSNILQPVVNHPKITMGSQSNRQLKAGAKTFYSDFRLNLYLIIDILAIKATIIHPATDKHIEKYSIQNFYIIDETPQIYNEIILPQLIKDSFNLQWVYNILEHKSESERIVFEDPDPETGFILVPDLKWNGEIDTLYLLAICHKRDIKSIRDLSGEHLPLLQNIRSKGVEAIEKKYGLSSNELRIYLHYQPSFYHLHVHFTYIRHEAPGILAERAHLLSNVISNLELLSEYYQKATIPFVARQNDKFFEKLQTSGVLKLKNV